jgi:glycolate oxidase
MEDVVVPRAHIPEMLRRLDRLAAGQGVTIATFGHAGDGNLHVNVLFDEEETRGRLEPILAQIIQHTLDLGGTLSGEHGIGVSKRRFLAREQTASLIQLQRDVKRLFDPLGLMNPGKLLPDRGA